MAAPVHPFLPTPLPFDPSLLLGYLPAFPSLLWVLSDSTILIVTTAWRRSIVIVSLWCSYNSCEHQKNFEWTPFHFYNAFVIYTHVRNCGQMKKIGRIRGEFGACIWLIFFLCEQKLWSEHCFLFEWKEVLCWVIAVRLCYNKIVKKSGRFYRQLSMQKADGRSWDIIYHLSDYHSVLITGRRLTYNIQTAICLVWTTSISSNR